MVSLDASQLYTWMVVKALARLPCTANEATRSAAESVAGGDRSSSGARKMTESCGPWAVNLTRFQDCLHYGLKIVVASVLDYQTTN